jgi:hypothetical protein
VKLGLALVAGMACLTRVAAVLADEAPKFSRVVLLLPACEKPGLSASELRSAISLDLRDEGLVLAPAGEVSPGDVLVRIEADCAADAELTLQVELRDDNRRRRIDLSELPPAQRARALSLSLAELLSQLEPFRAPPAGSDAAQGSPDAAVPAPPASPSEPAASAKPPATPPAKVTKPAPQAPLEASPERAAAEDPDRERPPPRPARGGWGLSLAPELRLFQTTSLWGGRALVQYGAWNAGIDFLNARQSASPGTVATFVVHLSCAYRLTLLGSPEGSLFEAAPRLGAGRTFMNAEANATGHAASAQDVYLDAAFGARYSFELSSALRLGLGAELGYARGAIGYADNLEIARTAGPFASLLLDGAARL